MGGLLGVGVLVAAAGAIFLAQPWWYRRRWHLSELTGDGAAELITRLEGVRQRAGAGPVVWLLQPLNARLSAFAFGRPGRRFVAVSGGAAVAAVKKPAAFDAVILHELAHVKNRDIDQTYLALAIWRAFVVAALLPLAGLLIFTPFTRELGPPQGLLWRVAVLALIVYLLRNSVLRSREFDADARVRELDPETQLGTVLAGMPPRTGWRAWHLGWTHPSGQGRAAALRDPAPLYRCGFWDGLAAARSRPGRHGRRGCRRLGRHDNWPVPSAAGGRLDPDRIRIQCGICVASASAVAEGYGLYDRHFRFRPARRLDSVPGYRGHAPGGGCGAPPAPALR